MQKTDISHIWLAIDSRSPISQAELSFVLPVTGILQNGENIEQLFNNQFCFIENTISS